MNRFLSGLVLFFTCLQSASYAFELRTASEISPTAYLRWNALHGPIQMTLSAHGSGNLPMDAVESVLQGAIQDWQNIPGKSYSLVYQGRSSQAAPNPNDKLNSVVWMESDWPYSPEVISVTSYSYYVQDPPEMADADILLNSTYRYTTDGADHTVDLRKVLLHELGHVLGLAHTSVYHASLFPYFNVLDAPMLKPDDRAGIRFLYGLPATELQPITPLNQAHYLMSTSSNSLPLPVFRWGLNPVQNYWLEFSATPDFQKKLRYNAGVANYYPLKAPQERALWNLSQSRKIYWRVGTPHGYSPSRFLFLLSH